MRRALLGRDAEPWALATWGSAQISFVSTNISFFFFFFNFFFSTFIYFWDRERQSMNGGGAEREGDTESERGSRL